MRNIIVQDLNIASDADSAASHLPSLNIFDRVRSLLDVGPRVQQATEVAEEARPRVKRARTAGRTRIGRGRERRAGGGSSFFQGQIVTQVDSLIPNVGSRFPCYEDEKW